MTFIDGYVVLVPAAPIAAWIWRRRAEPEWTLLALLALAHATAVVALTLIPVPIAGQELWRETRAS